MKSQWFKDRRSYELMKVLTAHSYHLRLSEVWRDFIRSSALTLHQISLRYVGQFCDKTEKEILEIQKRHPEWKTTLAAGFGMLINIMTEKGISDFLGDTYQELDAANQWHGQFFTPMPLCRAMAEMTLGGKDEFEKRFQEDPHRITINEPACGGGATLLGILECFKQWDVPPSVFYMVGIDIDSMCVDMAFIQLSLFNAPATIYCADTLRNPACIDAPSYTTIAGRMFPLKKQGRAINLSQRSKSPNPRRVIRDR